MGVDSSVPNTCEEAEIDGGGSAGGAGGVGGAIQINFHLLGAALCAVLFIVVMHKFYRRWPTVSGDKRKNALIAEVAVFEN